MIVMNALKRKKRLKFPKVFRLIPKRRVCHPSRKVFNLKLYLTKASEN